MICQQCGDYFPRSAVIDGKFRNMQRRKFCTKCSPFGTHNTRKTLGPKIDLKEFNCSICGREIGSRRKRCNACNTKIRRIRCKLAAIQYLGGKCSDCGYERHTAALEFHHIDPSEKEFELGSVANKSWDVVKQELSKCVLLCSNCHRIKHSDRECDMLMEHVKNYNGKMLTMDS